MFKIAETIDLGPIDELDKIRIKEDLSIRKQISAVIKKSKSIAKLDCCYYCGRKVDGFCNSHSIPQFALKKIAEEGDVLTINSLIDFPALEYEKGVKKAGTFQLICRDCDNKLFSDYENPDNYSQEPTAKMIAQIALKNYLKAISKRKIELELSDATRSVLGIGNPYMDMKEHENRLDLNEYEKGYTKAKKAIEKHLQNDYYMCYYKKLDYVVPIAFQSQVALVFDLEDKVINDIFYPSPDYEIKNLHISIFPLENRSVIFMFVDGKDKRYRNFYRQFNKLELEDQLAVLTFIMFAYSEEVYFSKQIKDVLDGSEEMKKVARTGSDVVGITPFFNGLEVLKEKISLSNRKNIPNILLEAHKITK
ncbi:MAG: hypothetical protein Q4F78_00735 [Bacillota bacterium]|nr:hypothetical protein [Bacillota bacterium]